jgi:CheY-like chemotaxis protein
MSYNEVVTASNGELALQSGRRDRPDLVLLDVNMPGGIDGFEVCRRLKADAQTRLIPIVLITGLAASEDRVRGIEAGADDFIASRRSSPNSRRACARSRGLKRYTDELDSAESVILTPGLTIEARDPNTQGAVNYVYWKMCGRSFVITTSVPMERGIRIGSKART